MSAANALAAAVIISTFIVMFGLYMIRRIDTGLVAARRDLMLEREEANAVRRHLTACRVELHLEQARHQATKEQGNQ